MKKRFIFDLDGTLLNGDFSKEINYFKDVLGKEADKFLSVYYEILIEYEKTHTKYDVNDLSNYSTIRNNRYVKILKIKK